MSQSLSLELSDDVYNALRRQAEAAGTSPERLAALALEGRFGPTGSQRGEAERLAARERFERHFGEIDLGRPTGADNESIDDDLVREYADSHEDA